MSPSGYQDLQYLQDSSPGVTAMEGSGTTSTTAVTFECLPAEIQSKIIGEALYQDVNPHRLTNGDHHSYRSQVIDWKCDVANTAAIASVSSEFLDHVIYETLSSLSANLHSWGRLETQNLAIQSSCHNTLEVFVPAKAGIYTNLKRHWMEEPWITLLWMRDGVIWRKIGAGMVRYYMSTAYSWSIALRTSKLPERR